MHGLGNDFMVIDLIHQHLQLDKQLIQRWADRHTGVGFDQLLTVETANVAEADFRYRIYNADGTEVEQCGNGARCFAKFVHDHGLTDKRAIRVATLAGILTLTIEDDDQITVDMGLPQFEPAQIPFLATQSALTYPLQVEDQVVQISAVSMGNPHAVLVVPNVDQAALATLGPKIEQHANFPQHTNVGFMEIMDRQHIRLRVFERGVGETLACGSGACAAMVVARQLQQVEKKVRVDLPGGRLVVSWAGIGRPVIMTGPASTVFEGQMKS